MVESYLKIITIYYYCFSAEDKLLKVDNSSYLQEYKNTYNTRINETKFISYLSDLANIGVLKREHNLYYGNECIFLKPYYNNTLS